MTNDMRARLTLRMNKSLDEELSGRSKRLGISKNAYILMLLTDAMFPQKSKVKKLRG